MNQCMMVLDCLNQQVQNKVKIQICVKFSVFDKLANWTK